MEKLGSIDGKGTISGSQNKTINDQLKHPGGPVLAHTDFGVLLMLSFWYATA